MKAVSLCFIVFIALISLVLVQSSGLDIPDSELSLNPKSRLFNYSSDALYSSLYSSYLGASSDEGSPRTAFDSEGKLVLVGGTKSYDFPVTASAIQRAHGGDYDVYVMKLSDDSHSFTYSTFLGGTNRDVATGICLDNNDNIIVTGTTYSYDFPITVNAIQSEFNGSAMGFVSKFDSSGKLIFSTYIGGEEHDQLFGMTIDDEGSIYVTGLTESRQLPVTPGALQSYFRGGSNDAFVVKIDSSGSRILYCTYFGAGGYDEAYTIKVNKKGEAIIAGATNSQNLPTTPGVVFGKAPWGGEDGYIVKISADGKRIVHSTYLGGSDLWDYVETIDIDDNGYIYAAGYTLSDNFPTTSGVIQPLRPPSFPKNRSVRGFVSKLTPSFDSLIFSTYLGGRGDDYIHSIYSYGQYCILIGSTTSPNFPITTNSIQSSLKGNEDAFLTIINETASELLYSTFYGGNKYESGRGSISEYDSSIVIGMVTNSLDYPISPWALQPTHGGGEYDAAIVKISLKDIIVSASPTPSIPSNISLGQSYPNPAISGASVTLPYTVAQRGQGSIIVYNATGQQVCAYPISHNAPGDYAKSIILPVLPKGLYFYTLDYNGKSETRKMVVR